MDDTVAQITAIITAPVEHGEAHAGFVQKERELRGVFARLSPADALALRKRLQIAKSDDPLTAVFLRLTKDRRDRIIEFLADPRRPFWTPG